MKTALSIPCFVDAFFPEAGIATLLDSQPFFLLFLVTGLHYAVGTINVAGFSVGIGAVLFVGPNHRIEYGDQFGFSSSRPAGASWVSYSAIRSRRSS